MLQRNCCMNFLLSIVVAVLSIEVFETFFSHPTRRIMCGRARRASDGIMERGGPGRARNP